MSETAPDPSNLSDLNQPTPEKKEPTEDTKMFIPRLANVLLGQHSFARDSGREFYSFENGIYKPNGDEIIQTWAKHWLSKQNSPRGWSTRLVNELVNYTKTGSPRLLDRPSEDMINVQNGLYDVTTDVLDPHDPKYLCTVQLPIRYDPEATCPHWEEFVAEVFPYDTQNLAWEIVAWTMTPAKGQQKALLFLGSGKNGKSTFLTALTALLGKQNICSLDLQMLQENRFATTRLLDKLACICADIPSRELKTTHIFKAITGGDAVPAEYKNGDSFDIYPFAKLIFSAGMMPRSPDPSDDAWYRRFYIVPFTRTFEDNPAIGAKLSRVLSSPRELSGVFNKALAVLSQVRERGITETKTMQDAAIEFRQLTDPLSSWLDEETKNIPEDFIGKTEMYQAYRKDSLQASRPPLTQNAFAKALKNLRPNIKDARRRIGPDSEQVWVYTGIGWDEFSMHKKKDD